MTHDGMPRAYLRMSPDLDQHPDPLAMLRAMCAAARQPERGRFREPRVLERTVGKRQYREMVQRGDVVQARPGPGVYLDGWDEWQEGDHTVTERMARMRARRRNKTVSTVTTPPSPSRIGVTTDAGSTTERDTSLGDSDGDLSPPPAKLGHRANGTNPRAQGTNPRANGASPRQQKAAEKRGGAESLASILARSNAAGRP